MFDFLSKKKKLDDIELPPLPELPDFPDEIPSIKSMEDESKRDDMPPMPPPLLETPITIPKFSGSSPMRDTPPDVPVQRSIPKSNRGVFINVESFKGLLNDLDTIRDDLKEYQKDIESFEVTREDQEKMFDKWQKSMHDVQKKLISTEKTLFNGWNNE